MAATEDHETGRFHLLGWAFVQPLLAGLGVALWCVTATATALIPVWIGILLVLGLIVLVRGFADLHRLWAVRALGVRIPRPYRPMPQRGWFARLKTIAGDPSTWRDILWLLVNGTAGLTLSVLSLALFAAGLGGLVLPFVIWPYLPSGADAWIGVVHVTSQASSYWAIPQGVFYLLLWWWLTPHLARAYAGITRLLLAPTERSRLADRVHQLTESRAETVDAQAAELRRIERDLHDGAQARLVALGMSLGMAEELLASDPSAAQELLAEARQSSGQALSELRGLVRGIHPPVLADRGLDGAVQALALESSLATDVEIDLPGRLPAPVESAAYFAVAETLTNVAKHSAAGSAWMRVRHAEGRLSMVVGDDGVGGADPRHGTGLRGIERRLAAFDGFLTITSPPGGPTIVTMELPCESSSPKTTPSSGTD